MQKRLIISKIVVVLIFFMCLSVTAGAASTSNDTAQDKLKEQISEILEEVGPSVVGVIGKVKENYDNYEPMSSYTPFGTGVVYNPDGYILTNSHVVSSMEEIVVVLDNGKSYNAKIMLNDKESDLAILKIEATGLKSVTFGNTEDISVGEIVFAIGTPVSFSLRNTATMGIISGINRVSEGNYRFIQSDAVVNMGSSGGPLVNKEGKVIGINSSKYMGVGIEGLNFSIPVDIVHYVLHHFENYGQVRRPFLGARLAESLAASYGLPTNEGLTVVEVKEGSAAEKAGLVIDDIVTAIDGVNLHTLVDYNEVTKKYLPSNTAEFTVIRGEKETNIDVEFGAEDNEIIETGNDNKGTNSYNYNSDGSLMDLSFLVGGINSNRVGHSYYGWSISIPRDSQLVEETFNARNVMIASEPRKIAVSINVSYSKDRTLEKYYESQKKDNSSYSEIRLFDSSLNTEDELHYAEFLYKGYYNGAIYRKVFFKDEYIYNVIMLAADEINPNNLKEKTYYKNIIDSFEFGYNGGSSDTKDLSRVQNGLVKYINYETIDYVESFKTWEMSFKPNYKYLYFDDTSLANNRFGVDEDEYAEVCINKHDTSIDLSEYGEKIIQSYEDYYHPDYYELLEHGPYDIETRSIYKLIYKVKTGERQYIYDENYIPVGELLYKVVFKSIAEQYASDIDAYNRMLQTFIPSRNIDETFEKVLESLELNNWVGTIGKNDSMTPYENKKLKCKLFLPGNWKQRASYYNDTSEEMFVSNKDAYGVFVSANDIGEQELMLEEYSEYADELGEGQEIDQHDSALLMATSIVSRFFPSYSAYDSYGIFSEYDDELPFGLGYGSGLYDDEELYDEEQSEECYDDFECYVEGEEDDLDSASKFYNIENIEAKGADVTVYTYIHEDDENEQYATVKIYIFEKGKYSYCFASILPHYIASERNKNILDEIWASFEVIE